MRGPPVRDQKFAPIQGVEASRVDGVAASDLVEGRIRM
jgi:hypothetical protein